MMIDFDRYWFLQGTQGTQWQQAARQTKQDATQT